MTNPFDNSDGEFKVLVNDEGQHSLWPSFRKIPEGWRQIGPEGERATCLAWIDKNWTDMRPASLVARTGST